jgi:hypothetical protein
MTNLEAGSIGLLSTERSLVPTLVLPNQNIRLAAQMRDDLFARGAGQSESATRPYLPEILKFKTLVSGKE